MLGARPFSVSILGFAVLFAPGVALAKKDGIASNGFGGNGCNDCHNGLTTPGVSLTGPAVVVGGQTGTFLVDITADGFHPRGGFNVSAPSGTFAIGGAQSAQTKLILNSSNNRNEVTHSAPKSTSGDHAYFSFNWQAPTGACTTVTLTAWGLSANNDNNNTFDRGAKTSITVSNCQNLGAACSANSECKSGFCADGLCCNEACGGSTADCRTCRQSQGAPADGTCGTALNGIVCRASAGPCDADEVCNGSATTCPADQKFKDTICRSAADLCDAEELCDGVSAQCPADKKLAAGAVCRPATDLCDKADTCDGTSITCPDVRLPTGAVCRPAAGGCDQEETCAANGFCPSDQVKPSSEICRAANGGCDAPEVCDGASTQCPADAKLPKDTVCRASAGSCDAPEVCDGASTQCPADAKLPKDAVCRAANGGCDAPEVCDGASTQCPADAKLPKDTVCRASAGSCDVVEKCDGASTQCPTDVVLPPSTVCRPSNGACDQAEVCNGGSGQCPSDSFLASGTVCRAKNGACDVAETCSGNSAACPSDGFASSATTCRNPSCIGDTETKGAQCPGNGPDCPSPVTKTCNPFICGANACTTTCTTSGDCAIGSFCDAGVCKPRLDNGQVCSAGGQCKSNFCADGVCCSTGCNGQCEACDVAGKEGTCSPVTGKPHGGRAACATDGSKCGGSCDGTNPLACDYPASETSCRDAACSNSQATIGATCDGKGACPAPQFKNCAPYDCDGTQCSGGCTVESDCQNGFFCEAGVCSPKKQQGDTCSNTAECATDYCVDGVCCDKPCKGQCEACNSSGNAGVCLPVVGEPQNGRPACTGDGSCKGSCDGANGVSCTFPGASVSCRDASCSDGVATLPAFCDSQGNCPLKQTQLCTPFTCSQTQCAGDCQVDSDCLNGAFCSAGICTSKKVLGDTCSEDAQCGSNHCADGVCCTAACDGQCEACNLPANKGTCSLVVNAQPSPGKPACGGSGDCQGYCDGTSASQCYFPTTKKLCSPVSCENNVHSAAAYCDGVGNCNEPKVSNCGAYGCGPGGCKVVCLTDKDCAEGFDCNSDNTCKPIPGAGGAGGEAGSGGTAGDGGKAGTGGSGGSGQAGTGGKSGSGGSGGTGGSVPEGGKGGTGGAGGVNAGGSTIEDFDPGADGGCGCRTAGTSPSSPSGLALAVLGLAAALRRRRK